MKEKRKISKVMLVKVSFAVAIIAVSLFSFLFMPGDPYEVHLGQRLLEPSAQFPLGTDNMGRCVLSRLMAGGRETIVMTLNTSLFKKMMAGYERELADLEAYTAELQNAPRKSENGEDEVGKWLELIKACADLTTLDRPTAFQLRLPIR